MGHFSILAALPAALQAQQFRLFDRSIQVHGFASQAYVYTNENNWLTMTTNNDGSIGFTDFGLNVSTQLTDKFRVGAQGYDRNLGELGQYHPSLDWAFGDYRFTSWFGVRAGKVKTTLGLYNDTQDLDFLRVFALLPQSVYPTDIRDATIAHTGVTSTATSTSNAISARFPTRPTRAIVATAFTAVTPTWSLNTTSTYRVMAGCSMVSISAGALPRRVC